MLGCAHTFLTTDRERGPSSQVELDTEREDLWYREGSAAAEVVGSALPEPDACFENTVSRALSQGTEQAYHASMSTR